MIKFSLRTKDGGVIIGMGLSAENVRRLMLGQPILFRMSEAISEADHQAARAWPEKIELLICYGKTEADIKGLLAPLISHETEERYP